MEMTFRWYGKDDPVKIEYIRQIPGMKGIVTAIYDIPVGEVWPLEKIQELKKDVESHGLRLSVIESVPVHEDIKLGLPTRDKYIDNYIQTIKNLGKAGIDTVCYNFMPVFDWTRSDLEYELEDGSTCLNYDDNYIQTIKNLGKAGIDTVCYNFMPVFDWTRSDLEYELEDGSTCLNYDEAQVAKMDPALGELELPGWDTSYGEGGLKALLNQYKDIDEEKLWEHLNYFIQKVIPAAEEAGVKMAIHPDDPPWGIFGLPRIITNFDNLKRFVDLYDSPSNGIALCTGSLGCTKTNDMVKIINYFGKERNRINFAHFRNVKITGERSFHETAHLTECGSLDFYEIVKAYCDYGFTGPYRPDHGRMIWGETGRPGYGLYDRALGCGSLDFYEIVKAYCDYGFTGPYRPDHGRMIWGETGRPGYGLYDRALGAVYINGLQEAILKDKNK